MAAEDRVIAAVRIARPSVVQILTQGVGYDTFSRPVPVAGAGSGVVFEQRDSTTYILTNYHVATAGPTLTVALADARTFIGQLVDGDPRSDLAVVRLEAAGLPVARLGDSDQLEIGETVIAIGNALGLPGGPTVSRGVVSATGRTILEPNGTSLYDLIQTDAAINPGNSGGPLINLQGEVVGLNTAVLAGAEGIGFAIAVNSFKPLLASLYRYGRIVRLWLGVAVTTATPALQAQYQLPLAKGALIVGVEEGGPAAEARLSAGDIVVELAGEPVAGDVDVRRIIASRQMDEEISFTVQRGRERLTGKVTLREMPRPGPLASRTRRSGRLRPQARKR